MSNCGAGAWHQLYDGTAATFVSDATIADKITSAGLSTLFPDGYVLLRDGSRYRIDDGRVSWMRDRNGNKLTFNYGTSGLSTIPDSLQRQVTFTYADMETTFADQITYKGFGGASRTMTTTYALLGTALRDVGATPQSYHALFPELNNASSNTIFNPRVVTAVTLPNGQQYQFKYSTFGELARIVLPTGGAIEYDYTAGSGAITDGGDYQIYRRLLERRVYKDATNSGSLEQKTTYEPTSGNSVTVDHLTPAGTLVAREKHFFYGSALDSLFGSTGTSYPAKLEGREYKAESYASDGTTMLRRSETNWSNRASVSWWWSPGDASEPANDLRITDTTMTVADVTPNLVSKQTFGYDDTVPFNNQNNVKEYDFGSGAAGPLLRETRTTFVTASGYTGTSVHLRSLASQVSVYDGGGSERARSTFEYDNYTTDQGNLHAPLVPAARLAACDGTHTIVPMTKFY